MIYLSAENIEKNFGERILFSSLNVAISKGDKAALIAANGTGKTSLLNILAKVDVPDEGQVIISENTRLSYLSQEPEFNENKSIREIIKTHSTHILSIKSEYEKVLKRHSEKNTPETEAKLAEITAKMEINGSWDYERRVEEMLDRFAIR
ncbi:MAG: ATP-binding cassette domain-containing protein, partial [Bacteroidota bacterium]